MLHQISNKELVYYFINEVFTLDKRKYFFISSNLKTRKKYLPSLEETSNYDNIGKEFVNRLESEFDGHDIKQRRANYYFFRKRFQRAYAEILGIPNNLDEKIELKEVEIEKEFKSYFNKNIASLPYSKLSLVTAYTYINLKYLTKVLWMELKDINNEEEFISLLHNKTSFVLKVALNQLGDIENIIEVLKSDFIFIVINNSENADNFPYYNKLKEIIKAENYNWGNYLRFIEIRR